MIRSLIKSSRLAAILATFILLGICSTQVQAASSMPTFALPNAADGTTVDSTSLNGKVLLINFFTTW